MGPWNPHPPGKTGTDDPTRPRRREGDAQLGVSEISPAGQFLKVNAEICRILGRSADALLQSAVWEVTHADDVARTTELIAQVLETDDSVSLDKRYVRPDGSVC